MTAEQKFKISLYCRGAIGAESIAKITINDAKTKKSARAAS